MQTVKNNGVMLGNDFKTFQELTRDPKFIQLSGSAVKVFIHLKSQLMEGYKNGDLIMPINQAKEKLNISRKTCQGAIKELEANGFIQITEAETNNTPRKYALLPFPI